MKKLISIILCLALTGCASVFAPKIGMSRDQWLHRTLIGDLVGAKDDWEIWKSGRTYYYFKNGKLDHIDQGQLMQDRYQIEIIHK